MTRRGSFRLAALLVVGALLGGGCRSSQPDLTALYADAAGVERPPVVVVHGVLGARLLRAEDGREVWPGGLWRLMTHDYADLALPIDPETLEPSPDGIEAYSFFDRAAGADFYGELLTTLNGPGGYVADDSGAQVGTSYQFFYDWRQDLVATAARLDAFIDGIRLRHDDPNLKVDIVAHSMGGLVVRYFIRYGSADVLDDPHPVPTLAGDAKVRKVVLLATPNFGSISGLQRSLIGARVGLASIDPEVGATWPSMYQLLPSPDRDWMIDNRGLRMDRDLYDVSTWRDWQWSAFDQKAQKRIARRLRKRGSSESEIANDLEVLERYFDKHLGRARRFHRALSTPLPSCAVRYVVFGGDCIQTPSHCLLETIDGEVRIRLHPNEVVNRLPGVDYSRLMLAPGDGRVTKASALGRNRMLFGVDADDNEAFPLAYAVFLCQGHSDLPGDPTFRDNLLNTLLTP